MNDADNVWLPVNAVAGAYSKNIIINLTTMFNYIDSG